MPSQIDRATAQALVEAGYMPLEHYLELFGDRRRGRKSLPGEQPFRLVRSATLRIEVPFARPEQRTLRAGPRS